MQDPPPPIDSNLACAHCGYNLRGHTRSDLCSECGLPVLMSIRALDEPKQRRFSEEILRAARSAGSTSRACLLVLKAVRQATLAKMSRSRAASASDGVSARDVCQALREIVAELVSNTAKARELLDSIQLRCSEDVGRVIFALVEQQQLTPSPGDRLEDFAGLFTLDTFSIDQRER